MPIFIEVVEDIGIAPDLEELNAKLETLQQKGAKIVDIKMSIAHGEHYTRSREATLVISPEDATSEKPKTLLSLITRKCNRTLCENNN